MSSQGTPSLYARRALESAAAAGQLLKWRHDLNTVARQPVSSVEACCRWQDGDCVADEAEIAGRLGSVLPEVVTFCCLLVRNVGGAVLPAVAEEYSRLLGEYYGVRQAEVTTAVPLDADTRTLIEARLHELADAPFALDERVDPSILGGIVLRVGDRIIDRSVRARLQSLRETVLTGDASL